MPATVSAPPLNNQQLPSVSSSSATPFKDAYTRRRFLANASLSALSLAMVQPVVALASEEKEKIDVGIIGCGARGKFIAEILRKHGGYRLVALADYFKDKVDELGDQFQVASSARFSGLSGYKRLLEQKLQAVIIESPPYFHPEQAAAAVDAGKHVYLAKPVAVDVPGCLSVEASGRRASGKNLCLLVDFQTPTHPVFQDAQRCIRQGELGRIFSAEIAYQTGPVGADFDHSRRIAPADPELRLRAWVTDRSLSGDVITEQNIHSVDMVCRMLGAAPLRAFGSGGKARDFVGDCWDHFSLIFDFPNGVTTTFSSKQAGFGYDDTLCRVYGTEGSVDLHYHQKMTIKCKDYYNSEDSSRLYLTGTEANVKTFYESVTKKHADNRFVSDAVRSNLASILGRTAAYRKQMVTWDEMLRENEHFIVDLRGLKV